MANDRSEEKGKPQLIVARINDVVRTFDSGRHFEKVTKLDASALSWAAKHKELPYTFTRGPLKGVELIIYGDR